MFFESLKTKNYRGLYSLDARNLNRVNIIGGLNGSGKTTILEALFMIADCRDPTTIIKPFGWRNIPANLDNIASCFFADGDLSLHTSLEARTSIGRIALEFRYELQPPPPPVAYNVNQSVQTTQVVPPMTQSGSQKGMTVRISHNNHEILESHLFDVNAGNIQVWSKETKTLNFPNCFLLSRKTIDAAPNLTGKFSAAIQRKEKSRVIEFARNIIPEINDLILLQIQGDLQLCGSIEPEVYVPISFLGDGATTMISIGMAMMEARGGVVFLDEFESTIHYSKLKSVWREITRAAVEYDCQIFAVTHSKEAIECAVAGAREADLGSKLKYMRIDRVGRANKVTEYSFEEVDTAIDEGWEIR